MWNLKKSREQFYAELQKPEENFWKGLFVAIGKEDVLRMEKYREFSEWKPHRANCPELDESMDHLIRLSPGPWKATMRNVFVARVLKGEANAMAWSFRQSGVVELNYGFTNAAMIYATLFAQYFDAIVSVTSEVDLEMEDSDVLLSILEEIDRGVGEPILMAEESRTIWNRERGVFAAHSALTEVPARRIAGYQQSVSSIEQFAVAHEVSHHMLGHTDESFRHSREVAREVDRWIDKIELHELWGRLNASQLQEVQADVGAFLLMSGALDGKPSRGLIYSAISGSMLGLTALAHIHETWSSSDPEDSHPDFIDRYSVISGLIIELSRHLPKGEVGDHPQGFLLQFRGFISMVLQFWRSQKTDQVKPPEFLNVFSWLLDETVRIDEEIMKVERS